MKRLLIILLTLLFLSSCSKETPPSLTLPKNSKEYALEEASLKTEINISAQNMISNLKLSHTLVINDSYLYLIYGDSDLNKIVLIKAHKDDDIEGFDEELSEDAKAEIIGNQLVLLDGDVASYVSGEYRYVVMGNFEEDELAEIVGNIN